MKKRTYGTGTLYQLPSGKWLLQYKPKWSAKRLSNTVEAANQKAAQKLLNKWVDELDAVESQGPEISMNHLFDLYLVDHRKKNRAETPIVERKIDKYLRPRIGRLDAKKFGKDELDRYLDSRLRDVHEKTKRPPENATLNREISIISRAMRLAAEKLQRIVVFEQLDENPPRQGIVSEPVYQLLLAELPYYVKPIWCFAYYTGVRSGQLLKLRWEWLDWDVWVIRAPGYYGKERITKNGEMHVIPIYLEMREFVKMMWETRNPACPYLFQRDGKRIRSFRTAFENVRRRLGLPELLFHDQRRTAVTNMIREGVPEKQALAVSGHLDPSMLRRYSIVKEQDVRQVAERMTERFLRQRQAETRPGADKFANEFANGKGTAVPGGDPGGGTKFRN